MKIRNAREAIRTKYAIRTKGDIEKAKEWAERCSNADWLKVMEMARQLIGPCYHAYHGYIIARDDWANSLKQSDFLAEMTQ